MSSQRSWQFFFETITVLLFTLWLSVAPAWGANGQLEVIVVDKDTGKPTACRMHLLGPNNNKPRKADKVPFWHDHFVFPGKILLKLPLGNYSFVLERGLEYLDQQGRFTINVFADDSKQIELRRFVDMSAEGWWSGDLDVRRPIGDIELLMSADDLHVAEVISWSNDKSQWSAKTPSRRWSASTAIVTIISWPGWYRAQAAKCFSFTCPHR
jgi:hypothetical protein